MTHDQIKQMMFIAAANGDWDHYHRLERKLCQK